MLRSAGRSKIEIRDVRQVYVGGGPFISAWQA
jgi:hypothetical protein